MYDISERKRAGLELAESEQRYRTLFETMAQGVAYVNPDGIITAANPAASRIFGLPRGELVGRNAWGAGWGAVRADGTEFPPEEFPSRVAMETGQEVKDVVMGILNPEDEAHRWIKIRAVPHFQAGSEEAYQIYLTFEDITGQVHVERALRESEERYRNLFESAPVSLWEDDFSGMKAYLEELKKRGVADLRAYFESRPEAVFECVNRAKVLDVNRATLKLYEAGSKADLLGPIEPVLDKESWRTYLEAILSIAEGRSTFEIETVNRTLQEKEVGIILSWSVAPGSEESYDRVMVSIVDISERKRIERSEREQRALAEALRDISSALSSTLDYEEVLDRILENIGRVADFDAADILLVENGTASIVRWRGYDQIATGPVDVRPLSFKISEVPNFRQMAESGLPLVIPDTREYSGWVDIPELRFIRSFAGAPIRARGQVTGFLNITSQIPGFFSSVDAPRLQALADQAAIALENSRLYEQVIAGRERMRLLTQQVVSAQEEERRRLSRELHDEAGQSLTALQIGLQLAHDEISPDQASVRQQLKGSIALAEATMDRMRFLAQNLRPPALDAIGLVPTLNDLCEEFGLRSGLSVRFTSGDVPDLSEEVNVSLYRLLQEALTNVIKHARAKQVVVTIDGDGREACLSIRDDGKGFDPGKTALHAETSGGIGLLGMKERLELIGGKLELISAPGSGATLIARVPSQADHLERREPHDPRRHRR